jgi:hypothetical protein
VPLPRVSQHVQRHHRPGLLAVAHVGRDGGPRGDLARPWLPCASAWGRCGGCRADGRRVGAHAGRQGQAVHASRVAHPRDLGQVPADESRGKQQGGIGWMALAMMVTTRVWLGDEDASSETCP